MTVADNDSKRVDISKETVAPQNLRRKEFTYVFLPKETGYLEKMNEALSFVRKVKASVGK